MREPHFFEAMADHLGPAYLRYSFTKGTAQEIAFLLEVMDLQPGQRVLDVGCGPGRHSHALAEHGLNVTGVDISDVFIHLAATAPSQHTGRAGGARFARADGRRLPVRPESMDAAICLCQGAFGLLGGGPDELAVLEQVAQSLKPAGILVLSAFSAYFAVRYLEESDRFDAATGVNREVSTLRSPHGEDADFAMSTTCFTPSELRLMCHMSGLIPISMSSVGPGDYSVRPADLDHPEWLVLARKA